MDVARIMGVGEGVGESAGRVWFMAYQAKFTRGRRGELVVGACVYLAGRIRRDPPPLMLIDFADRLNDVSNCTEKRVAHSLISYYVHCNRSMSLMSEQSTSNSLELLTSRMLSPSTLPSISTVLPVFLNSGTI
jgi:transcription initiation factor TFIIIB Brf1 subunit/transcription initiation factor TFIIB